MMYSAVFHDPSGIYSVGNMIEDENSAHVLCTDSKFFPVICTGADLEMQTLYIIQVLKSLKIIYTVFLSIIGKKITIYSSLK